MTRRTAGRRYGAAAPAAMGPARLRRRRVRRRQVAGWLRALLLVVALFIIVVAVWLTLDGRFYVFDPAVVGADTVPQEDIIAASRLIGLHIFWVRPERVEADILTSQPGIASATLRCKLPAECTIFVVERPPLITWQDGGQLWRIDDAGRAVMAEAPLEDGWYVQGLLPLDDEDRLEEPVRIGLQELAQQGVEMTHGIYYTADHGIAFVDQRGWLVVVGVGPGMAERLASLEQVAAALVADGTTPEWVDVHLADRPYCELSEG